MNQISNISISLFHFVLTAPLLCFRSDDIRNWIYYIWPQTWDILYLTSNILSDIAYIISNLQYIRHYNNCNDTSNPRMSQYHFILKHPSEYSVTGTRLCNSLLNHTYAVLVIDTWCDFLFVLSQIYAIHVTYLLLMANIRDIDKDFP